MFRPAWDWTVSVFDKLQHRLARLCWGRTVAACVDTMARARDQQGRDTAGMLAALSRQHRCRDDENFIGSILFIHLFQIQNTKLVNVTVNYL